MNLMGGAGPNPCPATHPGGFHLPIEERAITICREIVREWTADGLPTLAALEAIRRVLDGSDLAEEAGEGLDEDAFERAIEASLDEGVARASPKGDRALGGAESVARRTEEARRALHHSILMA